MDCPACKQTYLQDHKFCPACGVKMPKAPPAPKKGEYKIPFDKESNSQLHYADPEIGYENVDWRDNFIFEGDLSFHAFERGRSAAYATFINNNAKKAQTFTVFLRDLEDIIPFMHRGRIKSKFTFVKRGQNYGLRHYRLEETGVQNVPEAVQFILDMYHDEDDSAMKLGFLLDEMEDRDQEGTGNVREEARAWLLSSKTFWKVV